MDGTGFEPVTTVLSWKAGGAYIALARRLDFIERDYGGWYWVRTSGTLVVVKNGRCVHRCYKAFEII